MPLPPDRVDYSPIIERPPIKWPNDARVALWIAPNVEHYEYEPEFDGHRDPWPRMPYPDVQAYSYRDYGNRVGFWRMLDVLDKHNIRCCVSLNMAVLEHFPEIGEAMVQRDYDFMSHGIYNTRYLNTYTEEQEREFYRDTIDTLKLHTGKQLKGMLGPAISGTERTPDLMAEAGLIYHTDWMHDDQPVPIKVKSGKLVSVPYSIELNDAPLFRQHYEGRLLRRNLQSPVRPALPGRGRERPGHVHCPAPLLDWPTPPGQVPGRNPGLHHVPRRRLADHGGRHRRLLPSPTTMTRLWTMPPGSTADSQTDPQTAGVTGLIGVQVTPDPSLARLEEDWKCPLNGVSVWTTSITIGRPSTSAGF